MLWRSEGSDRNDKRGLRTIPVLGWQDDLGVAVLSGVKFGAVRGAMFGAIQGFGGAVRVLSISLNIGISGATGAAFGGLVGGVLNAGVAVFTSPIVVHKEVCC